VRRGDASRAAGSTQTVQTGRSRSYGGAGPVRTLRDDTRLLAFGLCVLVLALAMAAAPASAQTGITLRGDADERGWIGATLRATPGTVVTIAEGGSPLATVTAAAAETRIPRLARWRCDRRTRELVAAADGATAAASVRTPSCRDRLAVDAPGRARLGHRVALRVRDRWRLGDLRAAVCVLPPGGPRRCRERGAGTARLRLRRPGEWRLRVRTPWQSETRAVRVARPGGRLRLLVTGDSMIQPLDDYLRASLRAARVHVTSEPRISTGISKPALLDWPALARRQAARERPDVTVVFLGANDGFPFGAAAPCCGGPWVAEYARRAGAMMRSWARGGRGRVLWLALPAPRGNAFRRTFPAVNAALRSAAAAAPAAARLVRLDRFFTPGWVYRDAMTIGGRSVRVRQRDGVHLSLAGASAAARIVVRTLRRERIVR
jgi:lysophospholipase L1-like esterase